MKGGEAPVKRALCALLALVLSWCFLAFSALAESATPDPIPEPTLSPDAEKYDPNHPENLSEDQLYALSAILISQDNGEVIFAKNPDEVRYPASTTKILTVLLAILFVDDLNETVTVSETAMNIPADSSTMGLQVDEEIRLIDVLYGTMLLSGNDGANVIAETVSGSIPAFVDLMNQTAVALGCESTHFANPHGYHDDQHYTTARDMAVIARYAMQNETFRQIAGTVTYAIPRTNKHRAHTITTRSSYMLSGSEESPNKYYYPNATGIKTGSHSHSGYCFVGSASSEGVSLISVVFFTGNRARWADTIKLMDYGFSQYMSISPVQLYNMAPITIETSNYSTSDTNRGRLQLVCQPLDPADQTRIIATKAEIQRMADRLTDTVLIQYTRDFIAPIAAGEQVGTLTYFPALGDPVVYSLNASRTVSQRENAPKTLEQIVQETYEDPNPFPPLTVELVLLFLSPAILLGLLLLVLRIIFRRRRRRYGAVPRPVSRHLK